MDFTINYKKVSSKPNMLRGRSQGGGRIGRGDHFLPHKFIKRSICMLSSFHKTTSECWRRMPGTQKGSPFSSKKVRAKYKRQKERQELGTETHPTKGVMKEKFPKSRRPSHSWVFGEFGISEGNITGREKKKQKPEYTLTTTASGQVAQTLASAISEWRLDREAGAASSVLRVRTRNECPDDNLRELI